MEPVDGLYPTPGEGLAAFDEHPEHLELRVHGQHAQVLGADRGDRDRVRVVGVGLAPVPLIEQPGSRGELRRDVHHVLAGLEEALRERPADSTGAFDGPHPAGPCLGVRAHRGEPCLVGGVPAFAEPPFVVVDDLDRRRQFVGVDPDDDLLHPRTPAWLVPMRTARWAVLLRAGQSLLEPHPVNGARRAAVRK